MYMFIDSFCYDKQYFDSFYYSIFKGERIPIEGIQFLALHFIGVPIKDTTHLKRVVNEHNPWINAAALNNALEGMKTKYRIIDSIGKIKPLTDEDIALKLLGI